jgi:hypothetical protein
MDTDFFPDSTALASSSMTKSHRKQIQAGGTVRPSWGVDDHLLALRTRIKPLRVLGVNLVNAALRARRVLWPDTELSPHMKDLADDLQGTVDRLRAWRHSSARAGADEALGWALSWYEGMVLDLLVRRRQGSPWIEDSEHIQRRQERTFEIAKFAETRFYIEGDDVSLTDEDEEAAVIEEEEEVNSGEEDARVARSRLGGDAVVTESADVGVGEEENVDEDIQADASPGQIDREKALAAARARRAAALGKSIDVSADDSLHLASEIGAQAASEAAATTSRASEPSQEF